MTTVSAASRWSGGGGCGTYGGSGGEGCPKPQLQGALAMEDVTHTSVAEEKSILAGVAERRRKKKKNELPPTVVTAALSQNRCGEGSGECGSEGGGDVLSLTTGPIVSRWMGGGVCGKDGGVGGEMCSCRGSRAEKSE